MFLQAYYGMVRYEGMEVTAVGWNVLYVEGGYLFMDGAGRCPKKCCASVLLSWGVVLDSDRVRLGSCSSPLL
jgi:hypothetical protein